MRNPNHEYADYDYALSKTTAIVKAMQERSMAIPYAKDPACTNIETVYRGRIDTQCNFAYDKGAFSGKPFPTAEYTGEYETYTKREGASFKKDGTLRQRDRFSPSFDTATGEWIYTCYSPKFRPITKDIQTVYEILKDYRQVTAGINHRERQVVIADFDETPFNEDTIDDLESVCNANNLPHFTYLEHHLDSHHFQIGWILDKPMVITNAYNQDLPEHAQYKALIRKVALVFGSDLGYRGWWCKNPNCVRLTDTYWFNDTVSKEAFLDAFDEIITDVFDEEDCQTPVMDITDMPTIRSDLKNDRISRNQYLVDCLRGWIWDYMNLANDIPPYNEVRAEGGRIAREAGAITGKGTQETYEVDTVVRSVYYWSIKCFTKTRRSKVPFNVWTDKAYREIRQINAYEVFLKHWSGDPKFSSGGKLKRAEIIEEIAKVNECTTRSARSHLTWVMDTAHIGGLSDRNINTLLCYLLSKEHKGRKSKEIIDKCMAAEAKYEKIMSEYISEEIAKDSMVPDAESMEHMLDSYDSDS